MSTLALLAGLLLCAAHWQLTSLNSWLIKLMFAAILPLNLWVSASLHNLDLRHGYYYPQFRSLEESLHYWDFVCISAVVVIFQLFLSDRIDWRESQFLTVALAVQASVFAVFVWRLQKPWAQSELFQLVLVIQMGVVLGPAWLQPGWGYFVVWLVYVAGMLCKALHWPNLVFHEVFHFLVVVGHASSVALDLGWV